MSTMHKHDPELVAALAEGALSGDAAGDAQAEIASCAQCSADLAAQRLALATIEGTAPPALTGMERARLRHQVRTELGVERAKPETRRTRIAWGAIAVAAASVVAIVAVAPRLGLLSRDGDEAQLAVTTAAPEEEAAEEPAPAATQPEADEGGPAATFAPEAPPEDLDAVERAEAPIPYLGQVDSSELHELVSDAGQRLERATISGELNSSALRDQSVSLCRAEAENDLGTDPEPTVALGELDGNPAVFWFSLRPDGAVLAVYTAETCELIQVVAFTGQAPG
ncbi:MAG: hypothetical protein ACE5KX_01525 [Acidimicrobiia bacterium]